MSWRAVVLTGVLYVAAPAAAQTCKSPPDDEICALVSGVKRCSVET